MFEERSQIVFPKRLHRSPYIPTTERSDFSPSSPTLVTVRLLGSKPSPSQQDVSIYSLGVYESHYTSAKPHGLPQRARKAGGEEVSILQMSKLPARGRWITRLRDDSLTPQSPRNQEHKALFLVPLLLWPRGGVDTRRGTEEGIPSCGLAPLRGLPRFQHLTVTQTGDAPKKESPSSINTHTSSVPPTNRI